MAKNTIISFFIPTAENNYRPALLSYKAFLIYAIILLLLRLFLATFPASSAAVESATLMNMINTERANRNLAILLSNDKLVRAAAEKSQDMLDRDYFAHIDPDGNYVWGRIIKSGYAPYKILGENLAIDFATAEGIIKAWLDSPTHRANLLHPDFADQGLVALYGDYQSRYTNVTTSLFGLLVLAKPKPASPQPVAVISPLPPAPPTVKAESKTTTTTPKQILPPPAPLAVTTPFPPTSPRPLSPLQTSRIIFTLFGIALLGLLLADTVIIFKHDLQIQRSHSSYHLLTFIFIVLVSILIWWW